MSNFQSFGQVSEGLPGTAPNLFQASTSDNLATITAAGYLNDKSSIVKANDIFFVNYSDTSTFPLNVGEVSSAASFLVSYSAPNWSLVQIQSSLNDLVATVSISAAQFNGMYAAPVQLIAAPGATNGILVKRMTLALTYGSAAFASGGVVAAQYDNTVHGGGQAATNTEAAADFFATANSLFGFIGAAPGLVPANKGIFLSNATGAFTTGTGSSFVATVTYSVLPV